MLGLVEFFRRLFGGGSHDVDRILSSFQDTVDRLEKAALYHMADVAAARERIKISGRLANRATAAAGRLQLLIADDEEVPDVT